MKKSLKWWNDLEEEFRIKCIDIIFKQYKKAKKEVEKEEKLKSGKV